MKMEMLTVEQMNKMPLPELQRILDNLEKQKPVVATRYAMRMIRSIISYRRGTVY